MSRPRLILPILAGLLVLVSSGCGGEIPGDRGAADSLHANGAASAGPEGVPFTGDAHGAPAGPVALVTGSTDGLGREVALRLAAEGMHLIIHGRNVERGTEVVAAIEADGDGSARFYPADFASLEEVQELADAIRRDYGRLDLLVNNAGVGPGAPGHERVLTPDGHELRFQVNYLAGYLLTWELLPLLRASAPSRIVSVTSRNQQPVDFEDLRLDRGYSGGAAYGRSKLAQLLMTMDLAEELGDANVLAFAVHPAGAMNTNLVLETGSTPQSTVEEGVEAVLHAIHTNSHPTGTFFFELEPRRAHEQAYDREARRHLREVSESLVREALPGR